MLTIYAMTYDISYVGYLELGTYIALCNFGEEIQTQNLNIYSTDEVIIQTQKYIHFSNQ